MNPQDLSAYITSLLRSGPEIIASFIMGVFFMGLLVLTLRRWVFPGRVTASDHTSKDADFARKDAEVAKKDAQIARIKAKLAMLDGTLLEKDALVRSLQEENATLAAASANNPPQPADYAAASTRCAELEAENRQLVQDKLSLEETLVLLRTQLTQVSGELAHLAKWVKVLEEENARLSESRSLVEG